MTNATTGHNNPPSPIDEITAQYTDTISEAENWLDGGEVTDTGQMDAVDSLRKTMRQGRLDLVAGEKSAAAPLHDAWKSEKALWKPEIDDFKRIEDGLVSAVNQYKQKLAAEKRVAERAAYEEAEKKRIAAEKAASEANASDIDAQREAAALAQDAQEAKESAAAASKDKVKGMRSVTRYEITDHKKLLNWIAVNDRDSLTAFIDEWARKNHKQHQDADGMSVTESKEAY